MFVKTGRVFDDLEIFIQVKGGQIGIGFIELALNAFEILPYPVVLIDFYTGKVRNDPRTALSEKDPSKISERLWAGSRETKSTSKPFCA